MIEQDAVAGIHAVGLAVVHGDPVGIELGYGVRAARVEGGSFLLRGFLYQAIQLAGTGLVEADFLFHPQDANSFQHAQSAHAVYIGGVFGGFEADGHVALRAQIVDFVGLGFLNNAGEVAAVAEVTVMQLESSILDMRVLVDVVNPRGVEA